MGGDDTITGNGNTRPVLLNATAASRSISGRYCDRRRLGRIPIPLPACSVRGSHSTTRCPAATTPPASRPSRAAPATTSSTAAAASTARSSYHLTTRPTRHHVNLAAGTVTGDASVAPIRCARWRPCAAPISPTPFDATGFRRRARIPAAPARTLAVQRVRRARRQRHITGNGDTRIPISTRPAGVTVDLAAGTATGDASVGTDTFTAASTPWRAPTSTTAVRQQQPVNVEHLRGPRRRRRDRRPRRLRPGDLQQRRVDDPGITVIWRPAR